MRPATDSTVAIGDRAAIVSFVRIRLGENQDVDISTPRLVLHTGTEKKHLFWIYAGERFSQSITLGGVKAHRVKSRDR